MQRSSTFGKTNTQIHLRTELDLPEARDFVSKTCRISPESVVALSEQRLVFFNSLPDAEAKRLRRKCRIRFELKD